MTHPPIRARGAARAVSQPLPKAHEHKGKLPTFRASLGAPHAGAERSRPDAAPQGAGGSSSAGPKRIAAGTPLEAPTDQPPKGPLQLDPLDPMARALAMPLSRTVEGAVPKNVPSALAAPDEVLLDRVLKRLSWGGTGRRGTARIELGAGSLAGATLLLEAEGRELTLEVEGADPEALQAFAQRLGARLQEKGIVLREVRQV